MLAFNDLFWFIGIVTLAIIPLVLHHEAAGEGVARAGPLKPGRNASVLTSKMGSRPRARPRSAMQGLSANPVIYQQTLAPDVQT